MPVTFRLPKVPTLVWWNKRGGREGDSGRNGAWGRLRAPPDRQDLGASGDVGRERQGKWVVWVREEYERAVTDRSRRVQRERGKGKIGGRGAQKKQQQQEKRGNDRQEKASTARQSKGNARKRWSAVRKSFFRRGKKKGRGRIGVRGAATAERRDNDRHKRRV